MLERTYKIFTLEIRKPNFFRTILLNLILPFIVITIFLSILVMNLQNVIEINTVTLLGRVIPYLLIISSCFVLTHEFSSHTDKIIFTGIYSRMEIIISKLSYIVIASLVLYFLYMLVYFLQGVKADTLELNSVLTSFLAFLLYGLTLGSFILFISIITKNGIITGVITYVLFFDLVYTILSQAHIQQITTQ